MKKKWSLKRFKELFISSEQNYWKFSANGLSQMGNDRGIWKECASWIFSSDYYSIFFYFELETKRVVVNVETAFERVCYDLPFYIEEEIYKFDSIAKKCKSLEETIKAEIPDEQWKKKLFSDYE